MKCGRAEIAYWCGQSSARFWFLVASRWKLATTYRDGEDAKQNGRTKHASSGRLTIMGVSERTQTLDECHSDLFEPSQMPCFWDILDFELLGIQKRGLVVVLDIVGTLLRSEKQELHDRIERLVEGGERTIVLNLKALTKIDSAGL